ncbi:MAG: hypothetical protein OJI67_13985 [Prosthecobacter sp.]|nr:hypothetical protein [Prosthecobacter sp.]
MPTATPTVTATPPPIYQINSSTALPAKDGTTPNSRTKIGIYEFVNLVLDPIPPSGTSISWSTTHGTLYNTSNPHSKILGNLKDPVAQVTVSAAISGANSPTKNFSVILPSSMNAISQQDYPPGNPPIVPDSAGFIIWAGTKFTLECYPVDVNFSGFQIKELVPAISWTYPNGTTHSEPAQQVVSNLLINGLFTDILTTNQETRPILDSGGTPTDAHYTLSGITYEYDGANGWTAIPNISCDHFFSFFSADYKGLVGVKYNGQPRLDGNKRGPWKPKP